MLQLAVQVSPQGRSHHCVAPAFRRASVVPHNARLKAGATPVETDFRQPHTLSAGFKNSHAWATAPTPATPMDARYTRTSCAVRLACSTQAPIDGPLK